MVPSLSSNVFYELLTNCFLINDNNTQSRHIYILNVLEIRKDHFPLLVEHTMSEWVGLPVRRIKMGALRRRTEANARRRNANWPYFPTMSIAHMSISLPTRTATRTMIEVATLRISELR